MYIDVLSSKKISSIINNGPQVTYTECLESIIEFREAEFNADQELFTVEFKNYHLGLEAEDASFWSKIQTVVRKLMEVLKAVASKITAYIQTVPGRIHNFVLKVSNWFAKVGLEARAKALMQGQNRKQVNPEKVKEFTSTDFGPMNFDEILLGKNTGEEAEKAVANKDIGGVKKFFIWVITKLTTELGSGFDKKFEASMQAKLRENHAKNVAAGKINEAARTAGADVTSQSGAATAEKAASLGTGKIYKLEDWLGENQQAKELMDMFEDAARAINATHNISQLPSPDTILGMVKTITNGNIEKQANAMITAVDRLKRDTDKVGRTISAGFNSAYASKDSEKVTAIREGMAECRKLYTLYIKMIVRIDTAAQRCTSNVIKYAKLAMACYVADKSKANAPDMNEAETTAQKNDNASNNAPQNNDAEDTSTHDSVKNQDFSHIFDF